MDFTTDSPEQGVQYYFTRPVHGGGPLDRTTRKLTNPAFWNPESTWSKAVTAGWWRSGAGNPLNSPVPSNAYIRFPEYPITAPPEIFDEAAVLRSGRHEAIECDGCAGGGTTIKAGGEAMHECAKCEGFGILFKTHEFGACSVSRVRELTTRRMR